MAHPYSARIDVRPIEAWRQFVSTALPVVVAALIAVPFASCAKAPAPNADGRLNVVATTNIVADLARVVGGDEVEVVALMGPGVDPHLYKASEGDVVRMSNAELIAYVGLHLEGKMAELFEQMEERGRHTVAVTDGIDRVELIDSPAFGGNYDPHVWFDVSLWIHAAEYLAETFAAMDSANATGYRTRFRDYQRELQETDAYVRERAASLDSTKRAVITSHDAFGYFGRAYGFEVRGLQGISTATEAGTADVQNLASFVADRQIPALFVESSVPQRGIQAVQAAVRARGFDVKIGGSLFSDALGQAGTPEGTYIGMVRYNVDTIVNGLLDSDEPVAEVD